MQQNDYPELQHFSSELSTEIKQYAIDTAFRLSRYIFTRRRGRQQFGYCTHCRQEFPTTGLRHNGSAICPKCQSQCFVKASGIGRKRLIDEAYFVYYEKSRLNPDVVVARGIYAVRDYSGDYRTVETQYMIRAWYVFEPGRSVMLHQYGFYSQAKNMYQCAIERRKSVFSLGIQYSANHRDAFIGHCRDSIAKAVQGTSFRYSTWESYECEADDMVKFFSLYAKYPCIEYLTKLGFEDLVIAKLEGYNTFGAINWREKSIFKVLRLTKKDLKEIRKENIELSPIILRLIQIANKDRSKLTLAEIVEFAKKYTCYFHDLIKILKYTSLKKADAYIVKQFSRKNADANGRKHWYQEQSIILTWRDYIADCRRLEMDLTCEQVLFPGSLYQAHQNTLAQVKIQGDLLLDKKIAKRVPGLAARYSFEFAGLFLRPAASTKELIAEGAALHHCVGTYGARYANGQAGIFVVRKASNPDKPFYTMEIREDKIIQCRGNNNCSANDAVSWFIEEFEKEKLKKKAAASA
ncbi:PcfJ domain-containing protein [Sporomusa acidovorans]|uniref:PcfJ-like protein n=1 Tax=Sporomusa acidovorans (strain ATCC 49682 / DSM 3132 / Mol) TaxID=1123286 RepID=A0ABZ3J8C5_SPOA4|nr:PcfJ domain-containing protein [Sporomusa acidovorans]OZC16037.1 hypothetical protein SPACI_44030 [Sporomusa acidovorans DSM 3132]SDD88928.1 PcfJ-like protein [Sporomusa acidovorans]